MATKIVTKNSSTASAVPTASDLVQGELAVNVADKRLFTENNAGAIVELGTNPSTLTVTGEITANGGIALGDGDVATFGDSDDLSIQHLAGTTYLTNTTGSLVLRSDSFRVLNTANSEQILHGDANGAVTAYYDNFVKLATTSTGIDVTGTATMDGLTVSGSVAAGAVLASITNSGLNGAAQLYLNNDAQNWIVNTRVDDAFSVFNATASRTPFLIATNGDISFYEDTGTTAKLFWDASAESLGIGTSSPAAPLDVVSSSGAVGAYIRGRSSDNIGSVYFTSNASAATEYGYVQGRSSDLRIQGFNNGLMLQPSGGNVGIGITPNAIADLHVADTSDARIWLDATSADTMELYSGNGVGMFNRSNSYLMLGTNNTERMRIDNVGNVGIGGSTITDVNLLNIQGSGASKNIGVVFNDTNTSKIFAIQNGGSALKFFDYTASAERMRIDSAGNLLVGKTTTGTSGAGTVIRAGGELFLTRAGDVMNLNRLTSDGDIAVFRKDGAAVGTIGTAYSGSRLTIGKDGHGLGFVPTSSAIIPHSMSTNLNSNGTTDLGTDGVAFRNLYLSGGVYANNASGAFLWNAENAHIAFGTNNTERMRIDSAGNVGIGLDGGYKLDVLNTGGNVVSARFTSTATSSTEYGPIIVLSNDPNDTTRYFLEGDGGGNLRFRIYSNGNIINVNNSYTGVSDEKLKENIVDAGSQWDDIKALRVRKYSLKEENASQPTQIGVIAQEVEAEGMSGLVYETADQTTAEDGSLVDTGEVTKAIKYSILYMKAVKALQEAMDRIETLETRIAALEE